jgi:hypothetical protein
VFNFLQHGTSKVLLRRKHLINKGKFNSMAIQLADNMFWWQGPVCIKLLWRLPNILRYYVLESVVSKPSSIEMAISIRAFHWNGHISNVESAPGTSVHPSHGHWPFRWWDAFHQNDHFCGKSHWNDNFDASKWPLIRHTAACTSLGSNLRRLYWLYTCVLSSGYQLFWKAVTFIVANISTSTHILLLCRSNRICQS